MKLGQEIYNDQILESALAEFPDPPKSRPSWSLI